MDANTEKITKKNRAFILLPVLMVVMLVVVFGFFSSYGIDRMEKSSIVDAGFEFTAMLASILLYGCSMLDGMQKGSDRQYFISLVFVNFIATGLDLMTYILDGVAEYRYFYIFVLCFLYCCDYIIGFLLLNYMVAFLGLEKEKGIRVTGMICALITAVEIILAILNLFFPILFEINEEGVYSTTALDPINSLYTTMITLVALGISVAYRKKITRVQFFAIVIYAIIMNVFLVFFQYATVFYINYGVNLIIFFIIYIRVNVQNGNKGAAIEEELSSAKKIQESLLPNLFPDFVDVPEFDLHALNLPAKEIGGDYYDFFKLDDDHIVFLVGDVVGHGVGASLFMATSKAMINMQSQLGGTPADVLSNVNRRITSSVNRPMSVEIWMGMLDIPSGKLKYVDAGLGRLAIMRGNTKAFEIVHDGAEFPVGEKKEYRYTDRELILSPGDRLFLFTDGVPHAKRKDGTQFGNDRLIEVLNRNNDKTEEELCNDMSASIEAFAPDNRQTDDITMLGFTYRGKQGETV